MTKLESYINRTLSKALHKNLDIKFSAHDAFLEQSPKVGNSNLHKPNTCLFRTQKVIPRRFGLDRFHCSRLLSIVHKTKQMSMNIPYETAIRN